MSTPRHFDMGVSPPDVNLSTRVLKMSFVRGLFAFYNLIVIMGLQVIHQSAFTEIAFFDLWRSK